MNNLRPPPLSFLPPSTPGTKVYNDGNTVSPFS